MYNDKTFCQPQKVKVGPFCYVSQTTKSRAIQLVFSLKFKLTQSSRYVRVCVASLPDTPNSPQQSINIEGNEGCYTSYCGMNINIYLMVIHIAAKQMLLCACSYTAE